MLASHSVVLIFDQCLEPSLQDEGPQDGTSSSALRPTTHPPVTLQQAQGLVRVPSGTNISLLRQPSLPSQHGNRFGHPKEEHIEKLYHMMELNNRVCLLHVCITVIKLTARYGIIR